MGGRRIAGGESVAFLLVVLVASALAANVTYDHRAIVIDGKRRVLVSGSIHYPRSTPELLIGTIYHTFAVPTVTISVSASGRQKQTPAILTVRNLENMIDCKILNCEKMWPDLIQKSKDGGLDVIETYVFWNLHEPIRNQYDFEGRKDLVKFIKLVGQAGLYAHLRIGPYVCAEWNYGGFPVWLHSIPNIELRTDNEPYKREMQRFTTYIVNLMKQEKLYASQGGPIILSQIENEYGNIQSGYGAGAKPYIKWAASMAVSQNTGVPWVMCQQKDAPDPIIDTCNGFYCDQYVPNSANKPKIWTENWSGWFLPFGGAVPYRPVEDLAFAAARFYQLGGTFQNYYMYHGGTNFARTTGGPFISTSYDYDAPIDEYGQIRQPKWGHLSELHKAIKLCEEALVATEPATSSLGPNLDATVYKSGAGSCAAFLSNVGTRSDANVTFNGITYTIPAWSVSILPDCKNVALNTAQINTVSGVASYSKVNGMLDAEWSWVNEPVGISKNSSFTRQGLLEQINTTADKSDYLWYSVSTNIADGSEAVLHVESLGHALRVFINGKQGGGATGNSGNPKVSQDFPITLTPGKSTIDLLSLTVGLQNYGAHFDKTGAGITGPVKLTSKNNGSSADLSSQKWTYQVGLKGVDSGLPQGGSSQWTSGSGLPKNQPLVWYKANFNAPSGSSPVAIDFTGMGKGEAWVNGQSIGRYWPAFIATSGGCTDSCDYRGPYSASKCLKNCGKPSQHLYHVPRSWLKPNGNVLVLFEEVGGDPTQISFGTRRFSTVCATVSEAHPSPVDMFKLNSEESKVSNPKLSLQCPDPNQVISSIKFASFGDPKGACGRFSHGKCSSENHLSIIQKACVGSRSCSIEVSRAKLGDSCASTINTLAVEASCT